MRKTLGIFAAICLATLSACFSPWTEPGQGTITIDFGPAGPAGRIALTGDDMGYLTHELILVGPGGTIREYIQGGDRVTLAVSPGTWTVEVRSLGPTPEQYNYGMPTADRFPDEMRRALGFGRTDVQAGADAAVQIALISAVEAANPAQLSRALELSRQDGRERIVVLMKDISVPTGLAIDAGQNVTLVSGDDANLTISRAQGFADTLFTVEGTGTLRFGRPGASGVITIDGGDVSGPVPLIYVRAGANLEINQAVYVTGTRNGTPMRERLTPGTRRWPARETVNVPGQTLVERLNWLRYNAEDGGAYNVEVTGTNNRISPADAALPTDRSDIQITLTGGGEIRLSEPGSLFTLANGVTLVLENVTLRGMTDNDAALVIVRQGGTLVMNAGATITENINETDPDADQTWNQLGGGVRVEGTLSMGGGKISENTARYGGGGVFVANGGEFVMTGGLVFRNHTDQWGGGGVFIDRGGRLTMRDTAIIRQNSSDSGGGGGVHVGAHADPSDPENTFGTFYMHGGAIEDNWAGGGGGGVFVNAHTAPNARGRFMMSGGIISGNHTDEHQMDGGGVFVHGDFTMSGTAQITHNIAIHGGGVSLGIGGDVPRGGVMLMQGGTISSNTAHGGDGGGGVHVGQSGEFVMSGGQIYFNDASIASEGESIFVAPAPGGGTARYAPPLGTGAIYTTNAHLPSLGTAANPFLVHNAEQLSLVGVGSGNAASDFPGYLNWTDDAYYLLVADIHLDSNWAWSFSGLYPPGYFSGNFDGGGFTIRGLAGYRQGLFYEISPNGVVRNLTLYGVNITGDVDNIGGLAGVNRGLVENVNVTGDVGGRSNIGGLVGRNYGTVAYSSSDASVLGDDTHIGGLVGYNAAAAGVAGIVRNSFAIANAEGCSVVGGLVGRNAAGGIVKNSFATGFVDGHANNADNIGDVGGLVGRNYGTVQDSYATGNVRVFNDGHHAGGVVGRNLGNGTVQRVFATGRVTGNHAGGIVGMNDNTGVVQNSVALNPRIEGSNLARVGMLNAGTGLVNNHARHDMQIDTSDTLFSNPMAPQGGDISVEHWHNGPPGFWIYQVGFSTNDWIITSGRLPRLRIIEERNPGLHNPTVRQIQ